MTNEFDPYLLLTEYLKLLPRRVEMPNPLEPSIGGGLTLPPPKKPMRFYEMMGISPTQLAAMALQYGETKLEPSEIELMYSFLDNDYVPSEEDLSTLDDVARRLYYQSEEDRKGPHDGHVGGHRADIIFVNDADHDVEAPSITEPVIREREVQSLPPAGETGAVVADDWWTKIPKK
jgi:hypothetical protein